MDKQQLLDELKNQIASGSLSRQEIASALDLVAQPDLGVAHTDVSSKHVSMQQVIYYIGGGIVFMGLSVLIGQNWDAFSTLVRILVTLGVALVTYIMAFMFNKRTETQSVAQPFYLISALLFPVGLGVVFYEGGLHIVGAGVFSIIFAICLTIFGLTWYLQRNNLNLTFSTIYATGLFFAVTEWLVYAGDAYFEESDFMLYRLLVVGISLLTLGFYVRQTPHKDLTGVYYFFGAPLLLGSTLALGGFSPDQNVFWELIYPLLSLGTVFLSTQLKSRALLVWGTLFFMGYLVKLTGEYFVDSVGWPAALIICGLLMIAVGFFAFRIKQEYINKPTSV